MARVTRLAKLLAASIALGPAGAAADPVVDKDTKCAAIASYLDRRDAPHAQEAYRAAVKLIAELDNAAIAKGRKSLLAGFDKEHAENAYILVIESCRDYPQQTLGQTASDTYDGLRELSLSPASR
jgi:hypothetical protein